jgi:hypothetical protein
MVRGIDPVDHGHLPTGTPWSAERMRKERLKRDIVFYDAEIKRIQAASDESKQWMTQAGYDHVTIDQDIEVRVGLLQDKKRQRERELANLG